MGSMTVKAISLWEPWATAMRLGLKRNETRSRRCPQALIGKPLLICAAKTERGLTADTEWIIPHLTCKPPLNFGMAVALVRVTRVIETNIIAGSYPTPHISDMEKKLGNYSPGRFAWITEPIDLEFTPFPMRGQQGLFDVELPEGIAA